MEIIDELFSLNGQVAVVTGAGRGIGEGIAKVLASAGAAVVCAARRTHEIEAVAREIVSQNGKAIAVTTDVTDDDALEKLARAALSEFGRLDIWANRRRCSPRCRACRTRRWRRGRGSRARRRR